MNLQGLAHGTCGRPSSRQRSPVEQPNTECSATKPPTITLNTGHTVYKRG